MPAAAIKQCSGVGILIALNCKRSALKTWLSLECTKNIEYKYHLSLENPYLQITMIQQLYYYYNFKVMLTGWRRCTMYSDISWMIRFLVKSVLQFRQEITVTCMLLKLLDKNRSKIIFMILLSASSAHICWEWASPHAQWVSLPPFRKVVLTCFRHAKFFRYFEF